ncbi:hypothetical protein I1E95_15830 [Synechococcus sp. CBW1107]|uniref:hypothetical protein n=1 Tax=Synechococcus sp. CBW1107 TaxID=2789857 RepID=UPI0018CF7B71|nr:hypothetical protein [Synechococcus sp. CBW1107]QPN56504.1 hypothetical protein I1E95_15830 [Synechococcus sp. CBW1107]
MATDHEISHGRDITWTLRAKAAPEHIREAWSGTSWIVEMAAVGTRDGKTFRSGVPASGVTQEDQPRRSRG